MTGLTLDAGAVRAVDIALHFFSRSGLRAILLLGAALAIGVLSGPARAADECGAPVNGAVTCTGSSYPHPGILYSVTGDLTLTLDNPNLVAAKTTTGHGAVYISGSGNVVINALRFQSAQTTGTLSNGIGAVNTGTAGSAIIRMDTGIASASGNALSNGLLASINNSAGTGSALITLNGGQVINTGIGNGASALNAGLGNATVLMTGGSVSTSGPASTGLRAAITNAGSAGTASITMDGGTVNAGGGGGQGGAILANAAGPGLAQITVNGGTVTASSGVAAHSRSTSNAVINVTSGSLTGGTNFGGHGIWVDTSGGSARASMSGGSVATSALAGMGILVQTSTGVSVVEMSGGTVTATGNNAHGILAQSITSGTYSVSVTGGTVTGGAGTGAAIRGDATAGGAITIGAGAVVNAGASGIALSQAGGGATITTAGTLTGAVNLSVAANTLDILGGAINGNISGGGSSALDFDLGAGIFTYGSAYTISGMDSIAMTSGSAWIEGTLNTSTLNLNGGALHLNGTATATGGATVAAGGSLFGTGVLNGNVTNAGVIAPGNSIGTLTINGDHVGNGGLLEIETELGDDTSPTDLLVVTGSTSGFTNLRVINVGGAGAQTTNGIKVIDVGGVSNGTFALIGDYLFQGEQAVVGGAYAYRLYQGSVSAPGDGDWYLRSELDNSLLFQAGAPLYEAYAGVLQQSFGTLETLQRRVGNRSWGAGVLDRGGEAIDGNGLWGRIVADHGSFTPENSTTEASYDVTSWRLQAGADGALNSSEAGTLIGGLNVEFGTTTADVASIYGDGSISSLGFGAGATLTFYGTGGFYLDGQAQVKGFNSTLSSTTAGLGVATDNAGFGYGLSLEAGQKVALSDEVSITPQAQLAYSSVSFDDFADTFGAAVSLDEAERLMGRIGISADYETGWQNEAGQGGKTHLYGIANLSYEILGGTETDLAGTTLVSENDPLWAGVGLGGSIDWDDAMSLYGEVSLDTSLGAPGDGYSASVTAGLRGQW